MSEIQEFIHECKEARNALVKIVGLYGIDDHLLLRTEIDSLLVMYDQLCERVLSADVKMQGD
jgi:hypothetical protein